MDEQKPRASVIDHYNTVAKNYSQQYERGELYNTSRDYPANYFRLQILLNSFVNKGIKRVIEVGVGEGTPISTLAKVGIEVWGFDIAEEMVKQAKINLASNGLDEDRIFLADIQDPITYSHALIDGQFDGLMAMGVMPHIENDDMVLENMSSLVRPGGSIFVEFRNKLFSLFTLNRYTADFILNDLLQNVNSQLKDAVSKELEARLRMDLPPLRMTEGSDSPGYDAILSKFHNPFEVIELFKRHKFTDIVLKWYHYHPAMPYLSIENTEIFRKEAIRLEHESSNWRGMFLCSAFIVEAIKS